MNRGGVLLGILALAGVLAFIFRDRVADLSPMQITSLVAMIMALMIVAGPALAYRDLGPHWLRNIALWVLIFAAIGLAYSLAQPYLPADFGMR